MPVPVELRVGQDRLGCYMVRMRPQGPQGPLVVTVVLLA